MKSNNNRRDFIKKGLAGFAGLSLIPGSLNAKDEKVARTTVLKRKLGNTGIELPIISIGASFNKNILKAALDSGVMHFDSALVYGNGSHETLLGDFFKDIDRKMYTVSTKIPVDTDRDTGKVKDTFTAEKFEENLAKSLSRLNVKQVDILYAHALASRDAVLSERVMDIFSKAKKDGKAKLIGVSVHSNEPEVIYAAIDAKIYNVILTSYNFRQPHSEEMKQAIKKACEAGIGIVAMKMMAGAFWDKERKIPVNCKAALKWAISNENICTCIPQIENFEQLQENLSVMDDLTLTDKEKADLKLGDELGLNGLYCAQCRVCNMQCKKHMNISEAMRSYMYAYGYKNLLKSKNVLIQSGIKTNPCNGCDECQVNCPMNFNVKNKLNDICRLHDVPSDFLT